MNPELKDGGQQRFQVASWESYGLVDHSRLALSMTSSSLGDNGELLDKNIRNEALQLTLVSDVPMIIPQIRRRTTIPTTTVTGMAICKFWVYQAYSTVIFYILTGQDCNE